MTASTTPTQALPTQGFKIEVAPDSAGAAGAYVEVGQVKQEDLGLPDDTEEFHEFTANSTPHGGKERIPANRSSLGPTTFNLFANPILPVQTTLNGYKDARTKIWVRITSPDGSLVLVQTGWISKKVFAMQADPLMLNMEFMPTGLMQAGSTYVPVG